jgi:hypothetical protein
MEYCAPGLLALVLVAAVAGWEGKGLKSKVAMAGVIFIALLYVWQFLS